MNHKLRVLVRVDIDPGHVILEVSGCLTQANYPALLHIMRRASRLSAGSDVCIDLHGASHLDPEILLCLRQLAGGQEADAVPCPTGDASFRAEGYQLILREPADLPLCLLHVGSDGEVLADLDGMVPGAKGRLLPDDGEPLNDAPEGQAPAAGPDLIDGLELSAYFEGSLDPVATVRALSDSALGELADALYRHLDNPQPSFGAHTWYELAAEELQQRYRAADSGAPDAAGDLPGAAPAAVDLAAAHEGPSDGELASGPALA
ncbi:hypothetical protein [Arthrobacter sp. Soil763]|uniref:hypothetical protein n=1 Tax=Arthrobacter sp. Soil763 TaxID=1736402 RepID=UPI000A41A42B|nr:hypothetical protein [Arthrobacter sp. Soil763]